MISALVAGVPNPAQSIRTFSSSVSVSCLPAVSIASRIVALLYLDGGVVCFQECRNFLGRVLPA